MAKHRTPSGRLVRARTGSAKIHDYSTDAHGWFQWAEATHAASVTLFDSENPFLWFGAAVLGHQAIEMFLKTILIGAGHRIAKGHVWGHDLLDLTKRVRQAGVDLPVELDGELRVFNSFFNELRYPTNLNEVDGLGQEEAVRLNAIFEILRPHAEDAAKIGPRYVKP